MSIPGSYKSVSETDRKQVLDAHKSRNDFLAVAKVLAINAGTAYHIVKTGLEFKLAKGGQLQKKFDKENVGKAVELLDKIHFLL